MPEALQGRVAGMDPGVGGAGGVEKLPGGGGVGVGEDAVSYTHLTLPTKA